MCAWSETFTRVCRVEGGAQAGTCFALLTATEFPMPADLYRSACCGDGALSPRSLLASRAVGVPARPESRLFSSLYADPRLTLNV